MNNKIIGIIVLIVALALPIFFNATPIGVALKNEWFHNVQTTQDETFYETRKNVENTCRSMIASYHSDRLVYEQYKNSTNEEKQSWAEQANMRANKTASSYNNYVMKNMYIWKNNIPNDIYSTLSYLN